MVFKKPKTMPPPPDLNLQIRNRPLRFVSLVRFLGLTLNENLSWKMHMMNLVKKLRCSLGAITKIRPYLNRNCLLTLYHSLMLSYVQYCITNWFHGNTTIVNKIQKLCYKYICMTFRCKMSKVTDLMAENNLLSVKQLYDRDISILVNRFKQRALPNALNGLFHYDQSATKPRSQSNLISLTGEFLVASNQSVTLVQTFGISYHQASKTQKTSPVLSAN